MWELDYKESWALKNWCFWTVVLEKTLESPLHCKEIQPVHSNGNHSWIFIGKTDAEAETPILWSPNVKLTHLKRPWCWERLKVAGRRGRQWMRWLDSITDLMDMSLSKSGSWWCTGKPDVLQSMGSQSVRHNWTELNWREVYGSFSHFVSYIHSHD